MILSQGAFCIILYLIEFLYNSHFEFFSGKSSLFLSSLPEEELPCFLSNIKISLVYCVSLSCVPHIAICISGRSVLPVCRTPPTMCGVQLE